MKQRKYSFMKLYKGSDELIRKELCILFRRELDDMHYRSVITNGAIVKSKGLITIIDTDRYDNHWKMFITKIDIDYIHDNYHQGETKTHLFTNPVKEVIK